MRIIFSFFILLVATHAQALDHSYQVGVGMTSYTAGRQIPSLYLGYERGDIAAAVSSTGYRTKYDYLAGYTGAGYYAFDLGDFLGAPARGGAGGGFYFSQRGYRDTPSSNLRTTKDFGLGPAFRVGIYPFSFMFLRLETTLAISSPNNIILAFQDLTQVTLGVTW